MPSPEYSSATADMIDSLAEDALNAAIRLIQERLAITSGDVAGVVFSDGAVHRALVGYIRTELHLPDIAEANTEHAPIVTDDMIRALRDEARAVGDHERARCCNAALGLPTGDGAGGWLDQAVCRARVVEILKNDRHHVRGA